MTSDLEKLSKQELLNKIRLLSAKIENSENSENIMLHEFQVHQVEHEMQNRELHKTQQQLEETRDNYADLYDFAPVNYFTFDEKGIIKNINLTGANMLGEMRGHIIGKPFTRWLTKEYRQAFYEHLAEVFKAGTKVSGGLKFKNATGELIDTRIESIRYHNISNNDAQCRSVIIDITESNKTKNKLFSKARQLQLITDSLPVLIAYINVNEEHLFANKIYAETFNFSPDLIINKTAEEIWGSNIYDEVKNNIRLCFAGKHEKFDMELYPGTTNRKYLHATLIPDVGNDSNIYGAIILIRDITDRFEVEALDRRRLLDIAHINRLSSMGAMAGEIAHELNQPLAAISIYSDACRRIIMSGSENQEKVLDSLSIISEQAQRAGNVIKRIREFTTKKELDINTTDINYLVTDALNLLGVEIKSHNVELDLHLDTTLNMISADKILIEQVIFNLVRNALEIMDLKEESQRKLTLKTSVTGLNEVEVAIIDSGPGITDKDIKTIFDPFISTKKEGMGLGLSLSKSIIDAHHGRIWAVPNQENGTAFCFTLPISPKEG